MNDRLPFEPDPADEAGYVDDVLTFRAYLPARGNALGNALGMDRDGELSIRLSVPSADRNAVMAFLDALGLGGEGSVRRLVVVDEFQSPLNRGRCCDDGGGA